MSACQFALSGSFCGCGDACASTQNTILYAELHLKVECNLYPMVPALLAQAFRAVHLPAGHSVQTHAQAVVTGELPVEGSGERYQISRALDFDITMLYKGQGPEFIHWESKPFHHNDWVERLRNQAASLHDAWKELTACLPQVLIQGYLWLLAHIDSDKSQFSIVQIGPYFCFFEFRLLALKRWSMPKAASQLVSGRFDKLHWLDCIDPEHIECHYLLEPLYELGSAPEDLHERRASVQLCSAFRYALENSRAKSGDKLGEVQYPLPRFDLDCPSSRPANDEKLRGLSVSLGARPTSTPSQIIRRYLGGVAESVQAMRKELAKPSVGSTRQHATEDRLEYDFGSPEKKFKLKRSASRNKGETSTSKRANLG
uniref:Uncharacterized protein n=1 Tax=Mycena chlorophos TaxID=658473 RepID=A0ABQ0KUI6_MYCCL|nr:predicted protein [Mycena chlorophos]